jgi:hypothetical protein
MNAADPPCFAAHIREFYAAMDVPQVLTYTTHAVSWVRMEAKIDIDRRILLIPNVVEDPEGLTAGLCAFCGFGFPRDWVLSIPYHFTPTGCKNGFSPDKTCSCGATFETTREASKHRIQYDCLGKQRRKQARIEELKRLHCAACKHQAYTTKDFDAHCATKSHHKATHPDEFKCTDCDIHFHYKSELDRHLQTKAHTTPEVPSLTCVPCGLTCRSKSEYDRHCAGKVHRYKANPTERPNLTCTLCGITRPSAAQYQAHLATAKHRKKEAEQQGTLEDPSSPDDEDAWGSPDRQSPVPDHSPPLAC